MTRDEIIRIARQAGYGDAMADLHAPALERFAALVAAAEREGCAQAAGPEDSYTDEWFKAKADSAKRIRARGQA